MIIISGGLSLLVPHRRYLAVFGGIWRYLAVLGGIGRYWAVLGGIGRYWAVLGGIRKGISHGHLATRWDFRLSRSTMKADGQMADFSVV